MCLYKSCTYCSWNPIVNFYSSCTVPPRQHLQPPVQRLPVSDDSTSDPYMTTAPLTPVQRLPVSDEQPVYTRASGFVQPIYSQRAAPPAYACASPPLDLLSAYRSVYNHDRSPTSIDFTCIFYLYFYFYFPFFWKMPLYIFCKFCFFFFYFLFYFHCCKYSSFLMEKWVGCCLPFKFFFTHPN
jgi:hypothetical protein